MDKNKNILLLLDGPAGAGKTTLLNIIARWKDFELMNMATTRKKRPSDGLEMECMSLSKFRSQKLSGRIILAQVYDGNKKWYGIKKKPLEQLQRTNMVGVIVPDWEIIDELRKNYNVVAIFLSAEKEILKERLLSRVDSDKKKNESINYIPIFLEKYKANEFRFDYYLENNTTLEDLEDSVKKILSRHKF